MQGADVKYIDPTYMIRAVPTNPNDRIFCKARAPFPFIPIFLGRHVCQQVACLHHCSQACSMKTAWAHAVCLLLPLGLLQPLKAVEPQLQLLSACPPAAMRRC